MLQAETRGVRALGCREAATCACTRARARECYNPTTRERAPPIDGFRQILKKSRSTFREDIVLIANTVKHALRVFSSAVSSSKTKPPPLSRIENVGFYPIERFI